MKVVAIIQARMGSTRLPGKVMKEVLGKPLLEYQLERVRRAEKIDEIVVATTVKDSEQPIVDLCERLGVSYYRGSEDDVLSRYYGAAVEYQADVVVRMTSDCPVIDPGVVDKVVTQYLDNIGIYDFVANTIERTYPRGMDVSVFAIGLLKRMHDMATDSYSREHVTPFIFKHTDEYTTNNVVYEKDHSHHRWTVDTHEDFILIGKIINSLYRKTPCFNLEDILSFMDEHPDIYNINAHIEQKTN